MTAHLPECFATSPTGQRTPSVCICDRLRACEQRVREDMALQYLVSDREQQEAEQRAFAAGVQAARDAVAALLPADYEANWCAAIDAIDALRGDA